jgi:hypothetical protein
MPLFSATLLARARRSAVRAGARLIVLAVSLGLSTVGQAEQLFLGIDGAYTLNSNFFSTPNNPDVANSFQIGPSIQIIDPDGRFRYDVGYNGAYQAYADQDGVNAWESRLRARATYDFTTRTSLRVTNRFRDISNLRFSRQDISLPDNALDPNQDRLLRNDVEVELFHDLTELLELRLRSEYTWVDFDENIDRNDSTAYELGGELRYQLATRHFVGSGLSYTEQDFEEALTRLGSEGQFISAYATWIWNVTDAITFTATGGPAWVRSNEDNTVVVAQTQFVGGDRDGDLFRANIASCNPGPIPGGLLLPLASNCDFVSAPPRPAANLGDLTSFSLAAGDRVGTDSAVTFFGGASITANLPNWNLLLSYNRRQNTTSGDGLASSLDRIAFEAEWAPIRQRGSTFVAGSWDRRETLTDATIVDYVVFGGGAGDAQRIAAFTSVQTQSSRRDNFNVIVGYRHRLNQNLAATLDGRYRRTEQRNRGVTRPSTDTYFVVLTIEYDYDPISF